MRGISVAGIFVFVLVLAWAIGPSEGQADAESTAPSTSSSPETTASTAALQTGIPPLLSPSNKQTLQEYGQWLTELQAVSFPAKYEPDSNVDHAQAVDGIATTYPGDDTRVVTSLEEAAVAVKAGYRDILRGSKGLKSAAANFDTAGAALSEVQDRILTEVQTIEVESGYRLAGVGVQSDTTSTINATIENWIDGDTVETDQGRVRLVGLDTPEVSKECVAAAQATQAARTLAPAGTVVTLVNPDSVDDTDKYDRLLRYVVLADGTDVGYSLLLNDLGEARYDSTDGYDWHPREQAYRATEASVSDTDGLCGWATAAMVGLALAADSGDEDHHARLLLLAGLDTWHANAHESFDQVHSSAKEHYAAAAREAAAQKVREAEAARKAREVEQNATKPAPKQTSKSGSSSDKSGYTGCRAYAPGGKTWKPIPCP